MGRFELIEQGFLALEAAPGDLEILDGIFSDLRAFKGAAEFPGLAKLRTLAALAAELLGNLRGGRMAATPQAIDLLFATEDRMRILVQAVGSCLRQEGTPAGPDVGDLIARLETARDSSLATPAGPVPAPADAVVVRLDDLDELRAKASRLERMTQLYAALSHCNQAIVWARDRQGLLDRICAALVDQGRFNMAWIAWNDPATQELTRVSSCGDRDGYLARIHVRSDDSPLGLGPVGQAIREQRPCILNDFLGSGLAAPWHAAALRSGFAAMGAFPIRKGGRVCAALAVYAADRGFFGGQEVALLEEVAGDVSFALDHQELDSRREQAEAALRRQKVEFETIFNLIPSAICYKDAEDRFLRVNEAACCDLGMTREQLEGGTSRELFAEFAEDLCRDDQEVLASGLAKRGTKERVRTATGDLRWFRTNRVPVTDDLGRVTGLIAIMEDITEPLRIDQERRSLEAQLQHAQKMESLGLLAGGIAHDMNNVLGAILGLASANLMSQPATSPAGRAFETISKAAVRGGKMVKRLLSFARQIPTEERELDLNAIVREEVELLEGTLLSKVRLELDLEPGLDPIRGDPGNLANALLNLCVNAGDAMPEHGTLAIRTRNLADGWVEVQVEDTGSGMTEEVLAKALDPFFTTKPRGKGTGLGLSMVYGTVQAHQGRMDIQTRLGLGTRVSLRFPAIGPILAPGLARTAEHPSGPGKARVLVADDDELVRRSILEVLLALGHQATAVASGEDLLAELAAGRRPDVIMLDLNMPGLGGAGTLPLLRARYPALPILIMTGDADQAALDLVKADPELALMTKPFSLADLQRALGAHGAGPGA